MPILHPDLPSWLLDLCRSLSWITWGIFVVDIVVRLFLADERMRYLVRHWYDVLVLALPLPDPPCYVGPCITCGAEDCLPIAQPWAVPLIYLDGEAYVNGGLCCEKPWVKSQHGRCAHPMIEK